MNMMNQMDNEEKLCPFRKFTETTQYNWQGDTPLPEITQEDFLPCLKEKCMAYCLHIDIIDIEGKPSCKLMRS
jgi:hypothetical protein